MNNYLVFITLFIVLFDFIYILNKMSIIHLMINFESSIFGSVFVSVSKLEFRITNQSSLIFLIPYCISLFLTNGVKNKRDKIILGITIFLGLIITIMSGRRAFQAVVFLAFILTPIYQKITNKNNRTKSKYYLVKLFIVVFIIPILAVSLVVIIEKVTGIENVMLSFLNTFMSAFDFSSGSGSIRADQLKALITGWSKSPLVGHGINSFDRNLIRSQITPWSYEMVYIALLFQTGLIGTIMFILITFFIVKKNLYRAQLDKSKFKSYYISIAVALTSFFIAGSSNPMVYYVWAWSISLTCYQKTNKNQNDNTHLI